jgi:hypothetical protein
MSEERDNNWQQHYKTKQEIEATSGNMKTLYEALRQTLESEVMK